MRNAVWLLAPVLLLLAACDSNRFYEQYNPIADESWTTSNKQVFEVPVTDTTGLYSLFFNIRHSGSYRYRNLFVFLETTEPNGSRYRDTLECVLARPDGKWYGSGVGDLKDHRFLFKRHKALDQAGTYRFSFEQAMRVDPLEHVKDIGLRIEKEG